MKKRWHLNTPDSHLIQRIANALSFSPITASVLLNRGLNSPEHAASFIHVALEDIRSPFEIKDIDIAVNRIFSAIENGEKILIFGDYDADGITSTSILMEFLTYTGANVDYYIPYRKNEGYGLQCRHISDIAVVNEIDLIITADCGSSSHEAILKAKDAGIDVIVIDHHNISRDLPEAIAVVNAKRHDCKSCFHDLSAVGMVFCVLICLRKHMRDNGFWEQRPEPNLKNACDLVALGTMADIVPLIGENRIFVKAGLDVIRNGTRPGIDALIQVSNIKKESIEEQDIAFRLAPRINAAGRIDHATVAVDLLTQHDRGMASRIAQSLNQMNIKRQQTEQKILKQVELYLTNHPHILNKKSLVLADKRWDEGVLGIVASKLVDKYFRPVILFALTDDKGKGSARSIPGFDLYDGLQACAQYLDSFGGHKMAAGLRIECSKMDVFKEAFDGVVGQMTTPDDFEPMLSIDAEIDFEDISGRLIDEIEQLKPYGTGNAEPVFMCRHVHVHASDIVGKNHRRMRLIQHSKESGRIFNAIRFNSDPEFNSIDYFEKIAFYLRWNRWNGQKSIQLILIDTQRQS